MTPPKEWLSAVMSCADAKGSKDDNEREDASAKTVVRCILRDCQSMMLCDPQQGSRELALLYFVSGHVECYGYIMFVSDRLTVTPAVIEVVHLF